MKRMNLIRAALFVVWTLMGTISLSAQNGWKTPAEANPIIQTELKSMAAPTPPPAFVPGMDQIAMNKQRTAVGCTDCLLTKIKKEFLERTLVLILEGATDTGVAVGEVRTFFVNNSGNNATLLSTIELAYQFMEDKL